MAACASRITRCVSRHHLQQCRPTSRGWRNSACACSLPPPVPWHCATRSGPAWRRHTAPAPMHHALSTPVAVAVAHLGWLCSLAQRLLPPEHASHAVSCVPPRPAAGPATWTRWRAKRRWCPRCASPYRLGTCVRETPCARCGPFPPSQGAPPDTARPAHRSCPTSSSTALLAPARPAPPWLWPASCTAQSW